MKTPPKHEIESSTLDIDACDELMALLGVRVDSVWREPKPSFPRLRQGWQVAAAGRVWHFASSDELRDPDRLNGWRNTVANCRRASRDEAWETLPALSRAQARRVVRLLHEVAERCNLRVGETHEPTGAVGQ